MASAAAGIVIRLFLKSNLLKIEFIASVDLNQDNPSL